MTTASSPEILDAIVARIKAYVDATGRSIFTVGHGRIYGRQAPDNAVFPHIVVRLINRQTNVDFSNLQESFDVEAMCYGKPRSKEPTERDTELLGDLVKLALLTWTVSSATLGLTFGRSASATTLPVEADPGDEEIVTVRVLVGCTSWPKYLTTALA